MCPPSLKRMAYGRRDLEFPKLRIMGMGKSTFGQSDFNSGSWEGRARIVKEPSAQDLLHEIDRLRHRLDESEETLRAIRSGDVDAIVVSNGAGEQVYTLQTAERIYRTILEEINEASATLSEDGTILFCNAAFSSLVRLEFEQIVGSSIREVVPAEEMAVFNAMLRKALQGGARGETTLLASGGRSVPVFLSLSRIESAQPILSILATDLTDQKRTERIVAEGHLSKAILENVGEAVIVLDTHGMVTNASRMAIDICGEYPWHKHFDAIFALTLRDGPSVRELHLGDLWESRYRRVEASFRRNDGRELVLLLSSTTLFNRERERLGLVLTMVDITEQQRMYRALQESEQKYRSLFESMSEGFVVGTMIHDQNGAVRDYRFIEANGAYERLTGISREESLKRTMLELIPTLEPQWIANHARVVETGEPMHWESFNEQTGKWYEMYTYRPAPNLFASVFTDISDRKRGEQKLLDLTEELESRVAQRTADLEKANRAKNEFLANMSHEIRTPLTGILGMTELSLQDLDLTEELRENLQMIRYSAKSLNAIINDLLDLSAIEAGRFRIMPAEFSLHEELTKLVGTFMEQGRAKGLSFELEIEAGVPQRIVTDPARVRQILVNLLNNALKFTPAGEVRLQVRRTDPGHLAFAVSDTGIGIPEDRINDIFQSFTQLEATVTKRYGGTGLGLAISRNLAELLGGSIDVESEPGSGSVFTLIIPVEVPEGQSAVDVPASPRPAVRRLRILLAEDNLVNQLVIERHLARQGHLVTAVTDGRAALEALEGGRYDLVLMDVQMPEMNGLEATRVIREGGGGRNPSTIPIIALTAYAMKRDRERFLASGMDGFVTKPVDFDELARSIAEFCG
jgi:PAS domain S-box-containing protein